MADCATHLNKARRAPLRTFADWNEPLPVSTEMDLVALGGELTHSYINSLVSSESSPGWTEAPQRSISRDEYFLVAST